MSVNPYMNQVFSLWFMVLKEFVQGPELHVSFIEL